MFRNVMPDDHTPIDLRVANSSRSVNTCFIAKTNQLVELLEANEFDTASVLVDETLANYKIFKDKKLADNNFYQSSINSFDACWQLVSTVLKIKTKKMEAQQLNLFEIRMEIEQAFHSSATSKLLFMILKELRVIFLENFLMVAANSCVQLSLDETMEKNKGNFLLNDDFISEGIEECELQLTYLLYLFRFSIRVSQNPYFKTAEMRASDEAFKDLLNSLDVQEHSSKMPSIIGSPEVLNLQIR